MACNGGGRREAALNLARPRIMFVETLNLERNS
jgi:hypothetical protein